MPSIPPSAPCRDGVVAEDPADDWDPDFRSSAVEYFRGLGGFFVSLRASTPDQHRSGASFRVRCGDPFRGRLLFKVGASNSEQVYRTVLIAFLDSRQIELTLDGRSARRHAFELPRARERVFGVETPILATGIHRLVLIFLDDDTTPTPGFLGRYDMIADLYVGPDPKFVPTRPTPVNGARADPAIATSGYGVNITSRSDRLQLAPPTKWSTDVLLYASFWGSAAEGDQIAGLIVLQDFEQLDVGLASSYVLARAGMVGSVQVRPRQPSRAVESLRAILISGPDREIAPNFKYDSAHSFGAYVSPKTYVTR